MVPETFADEALSPSFPESAPSYGFLLWLNRAAGETECCAPRWECDPLIKDGYLPAGSHILDGGGASDAPPSTGVGIGALAKFMYILPETDTVVVTLGLTYGSSLACHNGWTRFPNGSTGVTGGYDEMFSATQMWRAISPALKLALPQQQQQDAPATMATAGGAVLSGADAPPIAKMPSVRESTSAKGRKSHHARRWQQRRWQHDRSNATVGGGSCSCTCPRGMGFGFCFNNVGSSCDVVYSKAGGCPAVGMPNQCHVPPTPSDQNASAVHIDGMRCELHSPCEHVSTDDSAVMYASFLCWPQEFQRDDGACSWSPDPCVYTPYFRPGVA